jgi:GNAT superfamily N-acetyltransferase
MAGNASGKPRIKRLRSIHRKMSFAAFERLRWRLGWKHEYYDGRAHIRPASLSVTLRLDLAPRTAPKFPGIRPLRRPDEAGLEEPFLTAFAQAPEYASYPADRYKRTAAEYLGRFFGSVRGEWSPVSLVAEANGKIAGAALVKDRPSGPLLDCLFVCPGFTRQGLATALMSRVVNSLVERGDTRLISYVMLANEPSLAWHRRFGFEEVPDLWIASYRWRFYAYEAERHRKLGTLSADELAKLTDAAAFWADEVDRLEEMKKRDFESVYPDFD